MKSMAPELAMLRLQQNKDTLSKEEKMWNSRQKKKHKINKKEVKKKNSRHEEERVVFLKALLRRY